MKSENKIGNGVLVCVIILCLVLPFVLGNTSWEELFWFLKTGALMLIPSVLLVGFLLLCSSAKES